MYGNTEKGLAAAIRGIEDEGVRFTMHRVPNEDVSYILADAYKSEGILVAMPTYEYKMFPPMAYVLDLLDRKHVNGRSALRIGSWGWVGGAKKEYDEAIAALEWNSLESLEWAGRPRRRRPRRPARAGPRAGPHGQGRDMSGIDVTPRCAKPPSGPVSSPSSPSPTSRARRPRHSGSRMAVRPDGVIDRHRGRRQARGRARSRKPAPA